MIACTGLLAMFHYSWRLMPAGPRKPVERHNGRVYWPTRDVAVGFVDFFHAPGRILGTQRISRGRDPDGGDVDENGCFTQVKRILRWIVGGDTSENQLHIE